MAGKNAIRHFCMQIAITAIAAKGAYSYRQNSTGIELKTEEVMAELVEIMETFEEVPDADSET